MRVREEALYLRGERRDKQVSSSCLFCSVRRESEKVEVGEKKRANEEPVFCDKTSRLSRLNITL